MDLVKTIKLLTSVPGVTSREEPVNAILRPMLSTYCDEVKETVLQSLYGIKKGDGTTNEIVLLDAHSDGIGLLVTGILDDGFIRFEILAGVDSRTLPASEVTVWGRKPIPGIICCKPPHLSSAAERSKVMPIDQLVIDTGLSSDKLKKLVRIGDVISLNAKVVTHKDRTVSGGMLDDRAGIAILLSVLEAFKDDTLPFDLVLLASSREECGTRGAKTAGYAIHPTEAVVVDVSHAHTPDASRDDTGILGEGPMIGLSPFLDRTMFKTLVDIAKEDKIPYQTEIMGGPTGTNATAIQILHSGVRTGMVSIPLKYMHSPVELAAVKDLENTSKLIIAYLRRKKEAIVRG